MLGSGRTAPPGRGSATLYTFLGLLLLVLIFALRMLRPFLLAILMGAILAIISDRAYRVLLRRRVRQGIAAFLVTSAILLLILVPVLAFVLVAVRQGAILGERLSSSGALSFTSIIDALNRWRPTQFWLGDPVAIERQVRGWLQSFIAGATSAVLGLAANLPAIFFQVLLVCLSCYFLLIDGRGFIGWAANKLPVDWDVRQRLVESFKNTAISVIVASISSAAIQAVLAFLALLVLGVPLPFLAAGATFILAWVPIIGSAPIWISAVVYLYLQQDMVRAGLMAFFGLIIAVSDNFVRPWVLGGRNSLHPLVALVAIFGGIQMFGYLGVFVGPILMAILISLLQVWPEVAHRFGLVLESGAPEAPPARPAAARTAEGRKREAG